MTTIDHSIMHELLTTPGDTMREISRSARALRLAANLTQQGLAARAGISTGTIKRFERTGEIQLNYLLRIALVLDRLHEFQGLFGKHDVPSSLFEAKLPIERKRGRRQ
jgi:transcriptional regulator with XRE-family HTH domain